MSHAEAVMKEVTNDLNAKRLDVSTEPQTVIVTKEMLAGAWYLWVTSHTKSIAESNALFFGFCRTLGFKP